MLWSWSALAACTNLQQKQALYSAAATHLLITAIARAQTLAPKATCGDTSHVQSTNLLITRSKGEKQTSCSKLVRFAAQWLCYFVLKSSNSHCYFFSPSFVTKDLESKYKLPVTSAIGGGNYLICMEATLLHICCRKDGITLIQN